MAGLGIAEVVAEAIAYFAGIFIQASCSLSCASSQGLRSASPRSWGRCRKSSATDENRFNFEQNIIIENVLKNYA